MAKITTKEVFFNIHQFKKRQSGYPQKMRSPITEVAFKKIQFPAL